MSGKRVSVDADALRQVLLALMGPGHLIRELQATIRISDLVGSQHPIKVLLKDFNDATNAPAPVQQGSQWWRKRADEIEAQVARSGSTEAMRCFTDMRTLLQAATEQPQRAQSARQDSGGPPERDLSKTAEQQGVFRKFNVERVDGSSRPGGKHHGCEYFVLDADHDPAAAPALAAYADAVESTHPTLAADMRARYRLAAQQKDRQPMVDAAAESFNNTFHKVRAEVSMDWWQRIWAKGAEWARRDTIKLTPAEIQSGLDRVSWAEGLILQLPENHNGRNSWLLNYGTGKDLRMAEWARKNGRANHTAQHLPSDDTEGGCIG